MNLSELKVSSQALENAAAFWVVAQAGVSIYIDNSNDGDGGGDPDADDDGDDYEEDHVEFMMVQSFPTQEAAQAVADKLVDVEFEDDAFMEMVAKEAGPTNFAMMHSESIFIDKVTVETYRPSEKSISYGDTVFDYDLASLV